MIVSKNIPSNRAYTDLRAYPDESISRSIIMKNLLGIALNCILSSFFLLLASCATQVQSTDTSTPTRYAGNRFDVDYSARLPQFMNTAGRKTVLVDPNVHAWGAYSENGQLIRAGIATAGASQCPPDARDTSSC